MNEKFSELKKQLQALADEASPSEMKNVLEEQAKKILMDLPTASLDKLKFVANHVGNLFLNINVVIVMKTIERHSDCDDDCSIKGMTPKEVLDDMFEGFVEKMHNGLRLNCSANGIKYHTESEVNDKLRQELLAMIAQEEND